MFKKIKTLNLVRLLNLRGRRKHIVVGSAIGLFVLVNAFSLPFALRLDLSKGKAYSLSLPTRKIVKGIEKEVVLSFYASSDLPTRLIPLKNDVVDLLQEYKKAGGAKIRLNILDPKKDSKALKEAQEAGIPPLQFSQIEQDKYAVTQSYFGISIAKGDQKETLPQVTDLGSLEYNLTAAIYKLTRKESPKVGIMGAGISFDSRGDPIGTLKSVFEQQFILETVNIATDSAEKDIDSSVKALMVFGDQEKQYDSQELDGIGSFLNRGGKAVFLVDGVGLSQNLDTTSATHNLDPLLKEWGITIEKNLILSASSELVNFGNESVSYLVPYPFWIKTNRFNSKSSYFVSINQLTYPWTSSITTDKKNDIEYTNLIRTTQRSWQQKDTFVLNPQNIPSPSEKDLKEFVITLQAKNKSGGQLVVIPSSRFVGDQYLNRNSDNLEFVLNIMNEFASGGALAGIRQRSVAVYPLPDIPENQKDVFKYVSILLLPVLFGLYGGIRLYQRR
ncbi:GldG family protein [Candidatus Roizmanbacteria bacterium]|nr:GldG family protein [Candidatus Roizmanbacteria bacterium]